MYYGSKIVEGASQSSPSTVKVYIMSEGSPLEYLHHPSNIMHVGTCGIGKGWVGEPVGRGEPLILPLIYITCSSAPYTCTARIFFQEKLLPPIICACNGWNYYSAFFLFCVDDVHWWKIIPTIPKVHVYLHRAKSVSIHTTLKHFRWCDLYWHKLFLA